MSSLRRDTLTRLNECENPPSCYNFPAADIPICVFAEMMYKVACASGYKGTEAEFTENFVNAISSAAHMKHIVVDVLPEASVAYADTIYMIKDTSITLGDAYKEYMLIDGVMVQIGDTSLPIASSTILGGVKVDEKTTTTTTEGVLSVKVVEANGLSTTENGISMELASANSTGAMSEEQFTKLANIANGAQANIIEGALLGNEVAIINENKQLIIPIACESLGVVKSSTDIDKIKIETDGTMSLNNVSITKLYVPEGDELIFNSGNA